MKRIAALVALTAALAGLVLLVSSGAGHSAQAAVERTAAASEAAGSARFELTVTVPASAQASLPEAARSAGPIVMAQGVMDYAAHRGDVSYGPSVEMRYDGDTTYVKNTFPWDTGPRWQSIPTSADQVDPLDLQGRALRNPAGLLDFLTGASPDARDVGSETVRGVPTQHYEGTLDLQLVVDQAPVSRRAELQDDLDFLAQDEPTTVPFGLWVGDDGVARRLAIRGQGESTTIEYYDFGVPVEITPPPADELITEDELFQELKAHANDASCTTDTGGGGDGTAAGGGSGGPDSSGSDTGRSASSSGDNGAVIDEFAATFCLIPTKSGQVLPAQPAGG